MKNVYQYTALLGLASLLPTSLYAGQTESIQSPAPDLTSGIVGHLGIFTGINSVREADSNPDEGKVGFASLDGSITVPFADTWLVSLDAYARHDDFKKEEDFDDQEDPEREYMLGAHLLYQFTPDTRAGLLVGYGDTLAQDHDKDDAYNVWMIGGEVHHFYDENLMVYAQFGYAFKGRDGNDDGQGFTGGLFSRVGVTYFSGERSTLNLDIEMAETESYIDGNDPGFFFGASVNYQHQLMESMPLFFTCFGRYDHINSTDEGDSLNEMQVGIGLRYYFGADSPRGAARKGLSIGMPRLPTRASAWTEYID